jgi:molybdopterin-containing oxidoreductase family iron-sulfur binding subunit
MTRHPSDRRAFLKTMGVAAGGVFVSLSGCDLTSPSIEEGAETITSYIDPQEWVIPGKEIWYASTCTQCPAGCGIHARVREGVVRKLEGNPDSPINAGRLCASGQAGLQQHFSPDRLQRPLARKDGQLVEIAWSEARARLASAVEREIARNGEGFALLTGQLSGHGGKLLRDFVRSLGGGARHFAAELISGANARRAGERVAGIAVPHYDFDKAALVLSIGADFLGTWRSPVHLSMQYAQLRRAPRGALIQVEPKMSLTGANADWWRPIRAGSEGWLMLGLAQWLMGQPQIAARLPDAGLRAALARYDLASVAAQTDIATDQIERLARALIARRPSLVLVGGAAETGAQGQRNVEAGWLLNHLLGNIGQTIAAPAVATHAELGSVPGSSAALHDFVQALPALDTVFVWGTNPVYSTPDAFGLRERMARLTQRVVFAVEMDETAALADLVIPVRSPLEDWGTSVAEYNPRPGLLHVQQPVVVPLHAGVPSAADLFLGLLAQADEDYAMRPDFHTHLRQAVQQLRPEAERIGPLPYKLPQLLEPPAFAPALPEDAFSADEIDRAFWEATVARGLLQLPTQPAPALTMNLRVPTLLPTATQEAYPLTLLPCPRTGLYDGRHANRPWLQELPDPLTTVVWDSWAEIHPETAARLGIAQGDTIDVASAHGHFEVKAMLFPGIHPESIAVALGQGHEIGRYAKGVGVNPLKILAPTLDADSGELALSATRVQIRRLHADAPLVKMAPTEYQHERRLVRTVSAERFNRTEKQKA